MKIIRIMLWILVVAIFIDAVRHARIFQNGDIFLKGSICIWTVGVLVYERIRRRGIVPFLVAIATWIWSLIMWPTFDYPILIIKHGGRNEVVYNNFPVIVSPWAKVKKVPFRLSLEEIAVRRRIGKCYIEWRVRAYLNLMQIKDVTDVVKVLRYGDDIETLKKEIEKKIKERVEEFITKNSHSKIVKRGGKIPIPFEEFYGYVIDTVKISPPSVYVEN